MSGVAQNTVYALRRDVEAKFSRLPLKFFDSRTHGEILSRAVNDLDNISSTLQQNLTQLITSVLSVIGIIIMMLTISWMLTHRGGADAAAERDVRRRRSRSGRRATSCASRRRSASSTATSPRCTPATPSSRRSATKSGRWRTFDELNEKYYDGAWRAQFVTGMMFPIMMFVGNLGYVAVAVIGGFLVTRRAIAIGDVQAFIQYSRQFSMPITQLSSIANTIQLTIASAERVFELLDEPEEPADAATAAALPAPRGDVQFDHVSLQLQARRAADRGHDHRRRRPARWWRSSAPPAPARRRWSTC